MNIVAYSAAADPLTGKLPIFESIESLLPYVSKVVIFDCSLYDEVDLSKYGDKVIHIRGINNPFDSPFAAMFNQALQTARALNPEYLYFLDLDEIISIKSGSLEDIIRRYPLDTNFAGIAFRLINFYGDRHHIADGPQSKGVFIYKSRPDVFHDMIGGLFTAVSSVRRVNNHPDIQDGTKLVDSEGRPMAHWEPLPFEEVSILHTSHLCPVSKMVRSILQTAHTSTIDLPNYFPFEMRVQKEAVDMIYKYGMEDLRNKDIKLHAKPIKIDYKPNEYLERFIERVGILEVNPEEYELLDDPFTGNFQG